jgi:hypothetical protein
MRDLITKLSILRGLLAYQFEQWRKDIWSHDLDDRYCCDGRECGCQGASYREIYARRR